jgi:hypothetical protein
MFCPQCGTANADLDRYCIACNTDLSDLARARAAGGAGQASGGAAPATYPAYQQPAGQHPAYQPPGPQYAGYQPVYHGGAAVYQPGSAAYAPASAVRAFTHVPTYLGWAIVTLLLCFWPAGAVAVVFAAQVSGKEARGDYEGALRYSRKAKTWCWISFGVVLAFLAIAVIIAVASAAR